ncbi:MAG: 1-acyl-sn-glycerol-3-phosphate acyltransferase [Deltaproteobacteria bacterium]|nr:1-acyl-sn-glycerol-3-phosphate acyltransferase [Deltaproteobacteria bacterium]MBW2116438.1 1-acyl-sn-glycerol-3-phosphate acyltransferase [Deltaproteobacteria bacterium]
MKKPETRLLCRHLKPVSDIIVTLLLWSYFTVGFIILFSPFYLTAYLFSKNREISFQRLNHKFYKGFFSLARLIVFGPKWHVSDEVRSIRSSVIVCNHISYLDPIFLLSLFEKQKTIVKSTFFNVPIFSRVLKLSGYIPSTSGTNLSDLMVRHIEAMEVYLASGGNFFVFPEGTRSRDGVIGRLNKGAFKIARLCKTSIKVLFIRNTNRLLKPGKFLFNTCVSNTITVELLASIEPDYQSDAFSISELMSDVRSLLEAQREKPAP